MKIIIQSVYAGNINYYSAILKADTVLVDVYDSTFNMNPELIDSVIKNSEYNIKAIMPVDLFGLPARYRLIKEISEKHGLKVIGDAAQSFGASKDKLNVGKFSDITTTSFFPAKPLGCYGDGGAIFTDSSEYNKIIRSLAVHGKGTDKYDNIRIGMNSRLDTLQAAILLEKLKIFEKEIELRNKIADLYREKFNNLDVRFQYIPKGYKIPRDVDYFHCTSNNTIYGTQIKKFPECPTLLTCDMSSDIFSRKIDVKKFDLIYGRPEQSPESWAKELRQALSFNPDHISVYQLTIEQGTEFFTRAKRGDFIMPNKDLEAHFYEVTQEILAEAGLPAYEISNHAKKGQESRHNLAYWRYEDYVGVGAGAHGRYKRQDGTRSSHQH